MNIKDLFLFRPFDVSLPGVFLKDPETGILENETMSKEPERLN